MKRNHYRISGGRKHKLLYSRTQSLFFIIIIALSHCAGKRSTELKNDEFSLVLATNSNGIPFIKKGYWQETGKIAFLNSSANYNLRDWLPQRLIPLDVMQTNAKNNLWKIEKSDGLFRAVAERTFDQLQVTWKVELPEKGSLFRMSVRFSNTGEQDCPVEWFPAWTATWDFPFPKKKTLKYWQALSYKPQIDSLQTDRTVTLFSNVYSSDRYQSNGTLPFWQIKNQSQSLFFSLSWCGGWQAEISERKNGTHFQITLPRDETQLVLKPGETVEGPVVNVFASFNSKPPDSRADWMSQRKQSSFQLFDKPNNWYPLIYNHWYAVRFNLSSTFIRNQLDAMLPYHFDVFVVDAGWYNNVGDWTPNRHLFKKGEFESALRTVKNHGIKTGIWSCPWLVTVDHDSFAAEIQEPRFYNKFMHAYALDLAGIDFATRLTQHISNLKKQFPVDWWKYDQELFGKTSREGKMKNVIALQNALIKVRQAFPDLNIENCMSGGRMINELTDQIAQSHWIRDGGRSGLQHARSNIQEALGAIQFLAPSKVQRWTNRLNEIDENNSELLKMYCRSAMIGVWGISTDLNKISAKQKKIILEEIDHYRKLAALKSSSRYEIMYPVEGADVAGIIFYDKKKSNATILLFRWDQKGRIAKNLKLDLLKSAKYRVTNIDTQEAKTFQGKNLRDGTCTFVLTEGQFSALYFINNMKIK